MKTSADGRSLIEAFEGLFLKTYNDGEGVLTIGYGHTTSAGYPPVTPGLVITSDRADEILSNDLAPVERTVARIIKAQLQQYEFDALVSFEFNTGDLAKSSIPTKINAGQKKEAMDTLVQYVHGANSGRVYTGLARRRKAERLLFEGDVKGALEVAGRPAVKADAMPKRASPTPAAPPLPPQPHPQPSFLALLFSALLSIFRGPK